MSLALLMVLGIQGSPFAPPLASLHYAPDRTCDLLNVAVDLDVNAANKSFTGHSVSRMSPLRTGIKAIQLNAGTNLKVSRVTVDGRSAGFTRAGRVLTIDTGPLEKGKPVDVAVDYAGQGSTEGFHWISNPKNDPDRVGFTTQGETESNSDWAPTWDYPNDLTTSETHTTVPAGWTVVGNGVQTSDKPSADGKSHTVGWQMKQPHATYLLSLVAGPFDVKHDRWEGVDLMYVVPKGYGKYIDDSFGDTKDMLSFYSGILGVKYAWPKYAQDAMYDFGGGMENVSATTLGMDSLTEAREGFRDMAGLNSHELGHQWFGDLVTCKDWGDLWLNESFATAMQMFYFEHSRGKNAYDWEIETNTRSYLDEAKHYKRPLSTKLYASAGSMFDRHTYPKGGVILHTLRRKLGDDAFFGGLNLYLTTNRHHPVESSQLRRAMTEATGINAEPFWAQWIEKPGHPVLDYTWRYDDSAHEVVLTVKQLQDTSDGTPVYDLDAKVGLLYKSSPETVVRNTFRLNLREQVVRIPAANRPDAVLLDPDHEFLKEIPDLHWFDAELPVILSTAPCGVDRDTAMRQMLKGTPSPELVNLVAQEAKQPEEQTLFPPIRSLDPLADLARPELRALWTEMLNHPNYLRRVTAVNALAKLPSDPDTVRRLREFINPTAPIGVAVASIDALSRWDAKANADVFQRALAIPSHRNWIRRAAQSALGMKMDDAS